MSLRRLVCPDRRDGQSEHLNWRPPAAPAARGVTALGNADTNAAYTAASDVSNFHPRLPRYGRLTHDQDRIGLTGATQFKRVKAR